MTKPKVKPENRDGGPYYGKKVPRSEIVTKAKPEHVKGAGYVWWMSGGDNWGVDLASGILPAELMGSLDLATMMTPLGRGGRWYTTEAEAMAALQYALISNNQSHY